MSPAQGDLDAAGAATPRRLYVFNGGFLRQRRLRHILLSAGYKVAVGRPGPDDLVSVWGQSPYAHRGEAVAARTGAGLVRIEDAWLRSLHPGRGGEGPTGLLIDHRGVHFDAAAPSDLEHLLRTAPLDDTALLDRAREIAARLPEAHLTKYAAVDPALEVPPPGYVLVVDQTAGDASVRASRADRNTFLEMLFVAQEEHPGARIFIKTHPETAQGFRAGHYRDDDLRDGVTFCDGPVSPWRLMEGAIAVYTVSSQLGFEAIYAGHRPRVFGQPFYAGWGLTQDERPVDRRQRSLSRAQLMAGAMILYPAWFDPCTGQACTVEQALEGLAARARAWRQDRQGWVASGMRLWKRRPLQQFFGSVRFEDDANSASRMNLPWMVWAGKAEAQHAGAVRVEDGFLRSAGLGAALVPPLSLVTDDFGIYYDPSRPSQLETLIAARADLRPGQAARAQALVRTLTAKGLSKYNLGGQVPALPEGRKVLVIGQVEDDASIQLGAGTIRTNAALLDAARSAEPEATLIYKPHPDVEAGLRAGAIPADAADVVARDTDITALLAQVDKLWTMTSLTGFEALLRGIPVTVTGAPFYAGWGLTDDRGAVPPRRRAQVSLDGLVHAALIDYPRYRDPVSGLPCSVEIVAQRLANGQTGRTGPGLRVLAKAQGVLASYAHLWR
ncbi:MAG: capsular polysaccharide biosynthesis protein [Pseudomonadota bacterium]